MITSQHPFDLTSVNPVTALHFLPPSRIIWPFGIHPFSPLVQTMSVLPDALYSPTSFLRTSPFLTLPIRDTHSKLLKHFISRTFTFLLSTLLIPHASAYYNVVNLLRLLLHIDTSLHLSLIIYCSARFQGTPCFIPLFHLCTTTLARPPSAATSAPMHVL